MTRWKAAGIHLAISAAVVGTLVVLLLLTWYPPAFVRMGKLGTLVALIGGIDLVVGPLLTLIVFKSGKPKLKLDLAIIGLLQVSAMAYGMHVLWQSRPVYLVAVQDRFELVYANEIDPADLALGTAHGHGELSKSGPVLVGTLQPLLASERSDLMLSAAAGRDIQTKPQYFVPYDQAASVLAANALPLSPGRGTSPHLSDALTGKARALGKNPSELAWVPITSTRGASAVMLIEQGTGAIVETVDIEPWENHDP